MFFKFYDDFQLFICEAMSKICFIFNLCSSGLKFEKLLLNPEQLDLTRPKKILRRTIGDPNFGEQQFI